MPWQIRLDLLEVWWLGDELEWSRNVLAFGKGVEPDEPVKAFELAKLRWSEGAVVKSVVADNKKLSILFENGIELHSLLSEEDEFSYCLGENLENPPIHSWSLTLSSDGFHLKTL